LRCAELAEVSKPLKYANAIAWRTKERGDPSIKMFIID